MSEQTISPERIAEIRAQFRACQHSTLGGVVSFALYVDHVGAVLTALDAATAERDKALTTFDWSRLREVLCNVSQIFNGWRGCDEWSTFDEDTARSVVAIQRLIEIPPRSHETITGNELDRARTVAQGSSESAGSAGVSTGGDAVVNHNCAWKDAIIDAAVVDWIYTKEHDSDPRKAVNDLLCWQQKIALDPAVSKEAHDLHQRAEAAEADLSALRSERDKLRTALAGLVGASDHAELEQMEAFIRSQPAPAEDKAAMVDAIHVLLGGTDAG